MLKVFSITIYCNVGVFLGILQVKWYYSKHRFGENILVGLIIVFSESCRQICDQLIIVFKTIQYPTTVNPGAG